MEVVCEKTSTDVARPCGDIPRGRPASDAYTTTARPLCARACTKQAERRTDGWARPVMRPARTAVNKYKKIGLHITKAYEYIQRTEIWLFKINECRSYIRRSKI